MINQIDIHEIAIPLRWKYSHARADHASVRSIICVVHDDQRNVGLGESVPRTYVTGETPESVLYDLERLSQDFLSSGSATLDSFCAWLFSHSKTEHGPFPSCAYCALELAVLDLLAHREGVPLARTLDPQADLSPMPYTASIGMMPQGLLRLALPAYRLAGFNRFKVKVGDPHENADIQRIAFIRRLLGPNVPIYADANGAWPRETAIQKIEQLAALGVWAIEEPLAFTLSESKASSGQIIRRELNDKHYADAHWLRERSPIPLIADESLISPATARQIIDSESFDILNIRLSKCGGFTLATEMIELARERGFRFGIGAMVAETSVLAAAGTHLGALHPTHQYIQGYSHTVLLKHDVVRPRAKLKRASAAPSSSAPGLGLTLDVKQLDRITKKKITLTS